MRPTARLLGISVLLLVGLAAGGFAQETDAAKTEAEKVAADEAAAKYAEAMNLEALGRHGKLTELPADAKPKAGTVSVWADFAGEKEGVVWVYVVNRTGEKIIVGSQELTREARDAEGVWRRCDLYHHISDIGDMVVEIPAGEFLARRVQMQSGKEAKGELLPVRMRFVPGLRTGVQFVSNEGKARIDAAEMEACRYDERSMWTASVEDAAKVALGKVKSDQHTLEVALDRLWLFRNDEHSPVLLKQYMARAGLIHVSVFGAVKNGGDYLVPSGAMVMDAIKRAGGFSPEDGPFGAAGDKVKVTRMEGKEKKVYIVNARKIAAGTDAFPLQDGDVLNVPQH